MEDWMEKCLRCKHCYTTKEDDEIKCRVSKSGVCKFVEVKPKRKNSQKK